MRAKLEVCVDSVESALIAQEEGADRLEVCANLIIGGTTPGVSQFNQIRRACDIDLNVLVRPRFGDFLYTDAEFRMIREDIQMFRDLGADGVVTGCLKADGDLDMDRMHMIRECAGSLQLTLHRAFDVCRNPYQALEEAVSIGATVITGILNKIQRKFSFTTSKNLLKNLYKGLSTLKNFILFLTFLNSFFLHSYYILS